MTADQAKGQGPLDKILNSAVFARATFRAAAVVVTIGLAAAAFGAGAVPLLCLAAIAGLAMVDSRAGYLAPHSYGLPGVPDGPPHFGSVSARTHQVAVLGGAAAVGVLGLIDVVAVWAPLLITAVVAFFAWRRAAPWVLGRHHARRVRRSLIAYSPRVAMGYAGRSGGPWQLKMWEPFILRSGERNVVINRHEKYVSMILEGADLSSPLIQLGSCGMGEIDEFIVPSIRAMFYVQNARTNAAFMAHSSITHVWLNHGDSDKPANYNLRHAEYDLIVVCGQAGVDRYARHGIDIPREQFVVLGRPQSSGIVVTATSIGDLAEKTVLYAPTWQGLAENVNFSSLEQGPEIVRALIERGAVVMFRPHPLSYRWRRRRAVINEIRALLKDDREASGRAHQWGQQVDTGWSIADLTNQCDALVSDVSSVVSDFLASGKPYAMTSMHGPIDAFREENPVAETGYVILGDMSNLGEALDGLLFDDPLAAARDERRRYVLGDVTGEESADAFAGFVCTLAEGD